MAITRLNNNSITSVTALPSGIDTGKVGQVISTNKSDTFSTTATSLTDITGLSASITPSSTSSKILILASIPASTLAQQRFFVGLKRDSTVIGQGDASGSRVRVSSGSRMESSEAFMDFSINFLDSPNTTSSVTYQVTGFVQGASTFHVNRTQTDSDNNTNGRASSTITLMEILA